MAGTGRPGFSADGGPATIAQLNRPLGSTEDRIGNLFIADTGNDRIRRVLYAGIITTVAGNGTPGFSSDRGPAIDAQIGFAPVNSYWALTDLANLAVDGAGNLFIAAYVRIRKVSPDGIHSRDGGPVLVQREMERGRSLLASIARVSAGLSCALEGI